MLLIRGDFRVLEKYFIFACKHFIFDCEVLQILLKVIKLKDALFQNENEDDYKNELSYFESEGFKCLFAARKKLKFLEIKYYIVQKTDLLHRVGISGLFVRVTNWWRNSSFTSFSWIYSSYCRAINLC